MRPPSALPILVVAPMEAARYLWWQRMALVPVYWLLCVQRVRPVQRAHPGRPPARHLGQPGPTGLVPNRVCVAANLVGDAAG